MTARGTKRLSSLSVLRIVHQRGFGRIVFFASVALIGFLVTDRVCSADNPVSPGDVEYFESKVRPLLIERCGECHSSETGADHGTLVLDSPAGIEAGGSRGPVLDREQTDRSLLLQAVRYTDVDLQMPPDGKLRDAEIAILERWVARRAVMPAESAGFGVRTAKATAIDWSAARQFWSFAPLANPLVPRVRDGAWPRMPLDHFVLSTLESNQLQPNLPAERAAWLRRVTYDCLGIPPTPAEMAEFLGDTSPTAFQRVVDRLLASPQMGERWARVWLDLARYTDSTPEWQNPTDRGWRYRDWIVQAFNQALPYDQFVRRQLAADLQPDYDPNDIAALGFVGLSPTYWKELRLAPAVIQQIVADEWDERIDAVSRTFLGLTVACARCHDHKFDPITTHDYYALAGVFASSQLGDRYLLPDSDATELNRARQQLTELEKRLKLLREQKSSEVAAVEREIDQLRKATPQLDHPSVHGLREASIYVVADGDETTKLEIREGEPRDVPVYRRGNPLNPGEIVPRRFLRLFEAVDAAPFSRGSGRAELADAILDAAKPLAARVIVNRIWDQHFQAGLVRTTSDFGQQGDRPSHPELLDYLAFQLVQHGWDLKWLHRQILLSATYGQSTTFRDQANQTDPDNRYLWRMNRWHLDFEMWRDAILAASGQLDYSMGGPSLPVDEVANRRRSLYVTIAREELHLILRMHDFPEASSHSPRRDRTVTPIQQLFVLNSPWMEYQTEMIWQRLKPLEPAQRIDFCYQLLFSRHPTDREHELAKKFLGETFAENQQSDENSIVAQRWQDYFQALLGLNEFHYLD